MRLSVRSAAPALLLALALLPAPARAQDAGADEEAVRAVVMRLFDAMRAHDADAVRSTFHPGARFVTLREEGGRVTVTYDDPEGFATAVGNATQRWDERVTSWQVSVDDRVASVWTGYEFWLDGAFSHCGVDSFELVRTSDGWGITQLADTRRQEGCPGR